MVQRFLLCALLESSRLITTPCPQSTNVLQEGLQRSKKIDLTSIQLLYAECKACGEFGHFASTCNAPSTEFRVHAHMKWRFSGARNMKMASLVIDS
jgi:hypothetical protein